MKVSQPIKGCLDAQATVCYEFSRLFIRLDPYLAEYIKDVGRSYQANDARAKYESMRLIEKRIDEILFECLP